uniref:Zinc finger CCCH-type protein n=1 Tax=Schrenkiella parvula TaxID=98039 RepID=E5F726_9BRAS|nr:zinc finger CCCH-type protein [Schrenkiella parvula]
MKKSRVSWPSDKMLCQVKMFQKEECPAKVASQSCSKPKASNLPPGYEGTEYATRRNISHIPRIRWKRPPKFILNDDLLVACGGESTETRCENLRIAKVLEAFYPHRSVIPTPCVSPAVEVESYDDSKTTNISLTPIEDEPEAVAVEPPHNSKSSTAVFGLGPDLSLAASAALSALMKTKEQGSLVDADLLVKFLSDPKIIKNLLNNTLNSTNNTEPPPRHVTSSAMDRNPPTITQPGNGVAHMVPVSAAAQSSVSVATQPPMSSALSMNINLQRPPLVFHTYPLLSSGHKPLPILEDSLKRRPVDDVVVSEQTTLPKPQSLIDSTSSTWNIMNKLPESAQTGTDAQIRDVAYPMNLNRDDYFKNLIRKHGGANNYKGRVDNNNMEAVKVKVQKQCMYFGRARGCKLGESCLYLHDRSKSLWTGTDVSAPVFPRAKRLKFGM